MPRTSRGLADGYCYHILNRGNNRQQVFHKNQDYLAFINLLSEATERYPITLFAYCLMPNHFHLLVRAEKGEELSRCMQWLMTSHVRRYHRHYGGSGHVWQGRYKSFIVQQDNYLVTAARYIEANPLRAGMVDEAQNWPWSSYCESSGEKERQITAPLPTLYNLNWAEFVNQPLTQEQQNNWQKSMERQAPFGEDDWQKRVCGKFGLESTLRPIGRPRKIQEK
ncbi:transposase [Desulfuromonas sp. AOP6]|uniref:REP-associated tyrosine transposase n=1 Tax=Desulfuromonas sp. AOP6 TaxID=1566351 RepID=UPI00128812D6|nr:transposase [Desulfuromonas sp. AOP6]BCA78386.1 transposase [Desulfuromonas sp. AOP6]